MAADRRCFERERQQETMCLRELIAVACCVLFVFAQPIGGMGADQTGLASVEKGSPALPLSPEQKARFEAGKELYAVICGACHQLDGNGQEGLAPPLAGSEWTVGSEARLVRMTLQGVRGPIRVKGRVYQLEMPPLAILEDDQIAALLTYIRREWGNAATPVEPKTAAKIRAETEKRDEAWTEEELLKIP